MRKFEQAAASIRSQIADGTLKPGEPAPSAAALSRETGYAKLTCRRALSVLVADGSLVSGPSPNSRARVPNSNRQDQTLADAKRELSTALAGYRHAAGLTQPQLASITGDSVTAIGHAETGRLWQSRPFWQRVDRFLNAHGELLRLHDAYWAAEALPDSASVAVEATMSDEAEFCIPGNPDALRSTDHPPIPAAILVVWSDGATTEVPIVRDV